ncbi:MAG: hypothetical protein HUU22_11920 [Phycisphaerae bacterium]|nr:hypothetical protein [Phycisphaerae bacterium]
MNVHLACGRPKPVGALVGFIAIGRLQNRLGPRFRSLTLRGSDYSARHGRAARAARACRIISRGTGLQPRACHAHPSREASASGIGRPEAKASIYLACGRPKPVGALVGFIAIGRLQDRLGPRFRSLTLRGSDASGA